jgi:hypothetical protein
LRDREDRAGLGMRGEFDSSTRFEIRPGRSKARSSTTDRLAAGGN